MKNILFIFFLVYILIPGVSKAQDIGSINTNPTQHIYKALVLDVLKDSTQDNGLGVKTIYQILKVRILDGERAGAEPIVKNDYMSFKAGEKLFISETYNIEDKNFVYSVFDKDRTLVLAGLGVLFLLCLFIFGGVQGVRGLLSLAGSVVLILFVLIPGILHGYSPILITIGVSSAITILGSYITHGFNRTTSSAVLGMIVTVVFTGALAYLAVYMASLSGFESEEAVYLNWNTRGTIDFVGLLFGGIVIGLLGVLYDVAIGQAIAVEELILAGKHYSKTQILSRGIRIGKEHTGALVNTLAIAYVGASLPLLLLFYANADSSFVSIINSEIFATELVRTLVGSIGLVVAVPITTFISVFMLFQKLADRANEESNSEHRGHHHH